MDEVELGCAVYGEGSVFPVKIARDAKVSALQKAIFDDQRYHERFSFPASALTLYLAKKDGKWLKDDDTVDVLLSGQIDTEYEEMRPSWTLDDEDYFGDFQLGEEEIHVLVELPPRKVVDPRLLELQELLLRHVLLDAPASTSAQSNHFKANLCVTYDCNMGNGKLRCMLLNTALPSELVIASHLFRRKNEFLSEKLMGIADIDDVRNDQLYLRPEQQRVSVKIFDPSVRPQRLFEKLDNTQRAKLLKHQALPTNWESQHPYRAPGTDYDIHTTFGDLEGRALVFKTVARPYKCCLNLQARLARKHAIEEKWIRPDQDDFQDFWSEGMSLAEKMEFFFANED